MLGTGDPGALACHHPVTWAHQGTADHSGQENRQGPPRPRRISKTPRAKTLWPKLPLARALTLAHPLACHIAFGFNLPASWGLTLKLGRPTSGPTQGGWPQSTGDLLPPRPERQTHPSPPTTWAHPRAADHSGWKNGQGSPSPGRHSKVLHDKSLGPKLALLSTLT